MWIDNDLRIISWKSVCSVVSLHGRINNQDCLKISLYCEKLLLDKNVIYQDNNPLIQIAKYVTE